MRCGSKIVRPAALMLALVFSAASTTPSLSQTGGASHTDGLPGTIVGGAVITSGPVKVAPTACGQTYALGGNAFYNVVVPSSGDFPIGCQITLRNVDPVPHTQSAAAQATQSGTTLTVNRAQTGEMQSGATLVRPGLGAETILSQISGTPGGAGTYATSAASTIATGSIIASIGAQFTGTADGANLAISNVQGFVEFNLPLSGSGIAEEQYYIVDQINGTPGGAGLYRLNRPPPPIFAVTVTIDSPNLIVTAVGSGNVVAGDGIAGSDVPANTNVVQQLSGSLGGTGAYALNTATFVPSQTLTVTPEVYAYRNTGGRAKTISGLSNVDMLYPGAAITLTSLGASGWAHPNANPKWQIPRSGATSGVRFFVSPQGSDDSDGLGGCEGGGALATIQRAYAMLVSDIDLRGSDPVTIQWCPGTYVGTQAIHAAGIISGRNGGAGVRVTGSPVGLNQCPDSGQGVMVEARSLGPIVDTELAYTWVQVDCVTAKLGPGSSVLFSANRRSVLNLSTGLNLGVQGGVAPPLDSAYLLAQNGGALYTDNKTVINILSGLANGYAIWVGGRAEFNDLGRAEIAFPAGTLETRAAYNFSSVIYATDQAHVSFAGRITLPNLATVNAKSFSAAGETLMSLGTFVPGVSGYSLKDGSRLLSPFTEQTQVAGSSMSALQAALKTNVPLNNTKSYFDGPRISPGTTGIWSACGSVTVGDTSAAAKFTAKLWDGGANVYATSSQWTEGAGKTQTITLCHNSLSSETGNLLISVNDATSTNGWITFNALGPSNTDSVISANRVR